MQGKDYTIKITVEVNGQSITRVYGTDYPEGLFSNYEEWGKELAEMVERNLDTTMPF